MKNVKSLLRRCRAILDLALLPLIVVAAFILKFYRRIGVNNMPKSTATLQKIGIFPLKNHYYEPSFNHKNLARPLSEERSLPGLDLHVEDQLNFLDELKDITGFEEFAAGGIENAPFVIPNGTFSAGDAEFLFAFIRHTRPSKVIEIGCGRSTRIIHAALARNALEDGKRTRHVCIEPFEQPWLECFPEIELLRQKVEDSSIDWKAELSDGDLLFIDSSHIIRPQGDVLYELLGVVPSLASGVNVHVHDIFTPADYLDEMIIRNLRFWNEQYVLEALLSNSPRYKIIAALNYLKNHHFQRLKTVCPNIVEDTQPGSFYFRVM